jgi:hypothetical protein
MALALLPGAACAVPYTGEEWIAAPTYERHGTGGDSAQLTGELADSDGCLVVRDQTGEEFVLFIPDDKFRLVDDQRLRLFGQTYRLGDGVDLSGGYHSAGDEVAFEGATVPAACEAVLSAADATWFIAYTRD